MTNKLQQLLLAQEIADKISITGSLFTPRGYKVGKDYNAQFVFSFLG